MSHLQKFCDLLKTGTDLGALSGLVYSVQTQDRGEELASLKAHLEEAYDKIKLA